MKLWKHIPIVVLALAASLAWAQGDQQGAPDQPPQYQGERHGRGVRGFGGGHGGRHAGAWLRKYAKMSPAEQEKALASDPEFQQLPAERQERLRRRLQEFNTMPPERKERILRNMDYMEHLTDEQKRQMRGYFEQFRQMPEPRRRMVKRALKSLREMSPEERERTFSSERFGQSFSKEEIELMRGMSRFTPPAGDDRSGARRDDERDPREEMLNPRLPPNQVEKPREE
ncbi:MAG TPA: DUF3106 domain-containing protein [Terriglobales bacterium]|nr:DUF3106 domain-containing protein [Terriglobales bacterium]